METKMSDKIACHIIDNFNSMMVNEDDFNKLIKAVKTSPLGYDRTGDVDLLKSRLESHIWKFFETTGNALSREYEQYEPSEEELTEFDYGDCVRCPNGNVGKIDSSLTGAANYWVTYKGGVTGHYWYAGDLTPITEDEYDIEPVNEDYTLTF